jgi:hypothetical protein
VKRLVPLTLVLVVLPSVALAARSPHDETQRLNKADMALAKQAAARKTDLPGSWSLVRSGLPKNDDSPCGFDPDLSAFVVTGVHERVFDQSSTAAEVVSDVAVFRNIKDSADDFKASAKPGLLRCMKSTMRQGLRQANLQGTITTAQMSTTPRIGAQSVFYRVVATTTSAPRFRLYMDFVAFRKGRSQAVLLFVSPMARVQGQNALARTVARRLR